MTVSQRERNETRTMIRARFKALRAGVEQRRADQQAEVERQINARYAEQTRLYDAANEVAARWAAELNGRIRELFSPLVGDHPEFGGFVLLKRGQGPDLDRALMRARATKEVDAQAKAALTRLAVAEADALEAVAMTALESDEAKQLLATIPTIDLLMPMIELPEAAAAEATVAEMADPRMPWRTAEEYGELPFSVRRHLSEWKQAQRALPTAEEQ